MLRIAILALAALALASCAVCYSASDCHADMSRQDAVALSKIIGGVR